MLIRPQLNKVDVCGCHQSNLKPVIMYETNSYFSLLRRVSWIAAYSASNHTFLFLDAHQPLSPIEFVGSVLYPLRSPEVIALCVLLRDLVKTVCFLLYVYVIWRFARYQTQRKCMKPSLALRWWKCATSTSAVFRKESTPKHGLMIFRAMKSWLRFWLLSCCANLSPPLWSRGQSSWLEIWGSKFDTRLYQILWEVVCLRRGLLSLASTIEELLEWKSRCSGLEKWDYGRRDPPCWLRDTSLSTKVDTNSADKRRSLGGHSSVTDSGHGVFVLLVQIYCDPVLDHRALQDA
jgi:hypothetical protein